MNDVRPELAARIAASPMVQMVEQSTVVNLDVHDNTVVGGPVSYGKHYLKVYIKEADDCTFTFIRSICYSL